MENGKKSNKIWGPFSGFISQLLELDYGVYTKENIEIKILRIKDDKEIYINFIDDKNMEHLITMYPSQNEYVVTVKFDDSYLYVRKDTFRASIHKHLSIKDSNGTYTINNCGISKNHIHMTNYGSIIKYVLSKECCLEYNLDTDKIFVCYKSFSDDNYIKIEYDEAFDTLLLYYNTLFYKTYNDFKTEIKKIQEPSFSILNESLSVPQLRKVTKDEINTLTELAKVYKENVEKLCIIEQAGLYNQLEMFVNDLKLYPIDAKYNSLRNFVNTMDIKDINALKAVKKDINHILKFEKQKKRKIKDYK